MAERRMFAKTIIDSDAFLDMPLSTQTLYFHLSMRADDDGFINNPKKIQKMIGASEDDLKLLIIKNFIIPFDSGIVVIKHWKIHNYIRNDRYKETVYREEMSMLETKKNSAYTLGIPNGYQMDTQDSIGKYSIGKEIDKEREIKEKEKEIMLPTGASVSKEHESKSKDTSSLANSVNTKNKVTQESVSNYFDKTYALYPRKISKIQAKKTYLKKLIGLSEEDARTKANKIYAMLTQQNKLWVAENGGEGRPMDKTPYFSSWLNANIEDAREKR